MNTFDFINKLAAYKVAVATGEVDPVKSVGDVASEPEPIQESFVERAINNLGPEAFGVAVGRIAHGVGEFRNYKTDQKTPIGELFADFANNELKKKGLKGEVFYTQTAPRTFDSLSKGKSDVLLALESLYAPFTPSTSAYFPKTIDNLGPEEQKVLKRYFSEPITSDMLWHADNSKIPPDRFAKAIAKGDDWIGDFVIDMNQELKNGVPVDKATRIALEKQKNNVKPFLNARGFVRAPRNNLTSIAHEFGHIESEMGREAISNSKIGPVYDFARTVLSDPMNSLYHRFAPDSVKDSVNSVYNTLEKSTLGKAINRVTPTLLNVSSTIPTSFVFGTKLLGTISPESIEKLKEKDPTGIINFIDEHPIASSVIAALPAAGREAATTIPGTKMTYNFWKAIKDGNNQFLKDHVFYDQVRKGLSDVSKISPGWEAAKFFGRNLGKTTLSVTAPILSLVAINKLKDWVNSRDE